MKKILNIICLACILLCIPIIYKSTIEKKQNYFPNITGKIIEKKSVNEPLIIYYGSSKCNACTEFSPKLAKYSKQSNVKMYYLDALSKDNNFIVQKYNLNATPTILIVKGHYHRQYVGTQSNSEVKKILSNYKRIEGLK